MILIDNIQTQTGRTLSITCLLLGCFEGNSPSNGINAQVRKEARASEIDALGKAISGLPARLKGLWLTSGPCTQKGKYIGDTYGST